MKRVLSLAVSLMVLNWALPVAAQTENCTAIGTVASAQGSVRVQAAEGSQWARVVRNDVICEGDTIQTGFRSRAAVNLDNQTVIRVAQGSTTQLENFSAESEAKSIMRMLSGVIHFFSRKPEEYTISTSTATIGIRGTEFVVSAGEDRTELTVFEGVVQAQNDIEPITLGGGETVSIVNGQTLRSTTLVQPRDLVQWGLYYPPVLALGDDSGADLAAADACARNGDFECAFDEAAKVAEGARDGLYYTLIASLQLAVGDIEAAAQSIDSALEIDADDANALALRAVVALTQNRGEQALQAARRAVDADPGSASAAIALSYVQQSRLELDAARATLQRAVAANPDNPLARARLAELQLALGELDASRASAALAVDLEPALARTHMVSGYAALSQIDTEAASDAFETALGLDSADPMAHLGLGLALIREGRLAAGRREFEIAVALDSNSAILRPYLGRAYYEENRAPLDAEQYAIAKQLDPNDPTAYLFDALRLHAENRPVEALQNLNDSIARNDNRAVYRGRNLLDRDRAARGASQARVYDTLGFTRQGLNAASASLATDPANDSAHRFLSDSYQNERRREIARVSELLQAQMLQDVNVNPVQPSISTPNLNLGTGAADVGLNEFTNLFESNDLQAAVSVLGGSNATRGAEAVVSGVHDSLSFSFGAYDFESDGWRENNGQDQRLGNVFVQWAATPKLNLQLEFNSRDSTEGDLTFNFDPDSFDPTLTNRRERDSTRFGLRYSPGANNHILVSHIDSKRTETQSLSDTDLLFDPFAPPPCNPGDPFFINFCFVPVPADLDFVQKDDGKQSEIQYIHDFGAANLVAGLSRAEVDSELTTASSVPGGLIGSSPATNIELSHSKAYAYTTFGAGAGVELTLGVSRDDYQEDPTDQKVTNSKFGLRWQIDGRQTLRLAWFESMKPALVNNRSLEPTQIAGFNQVFDDANGTLSETDAIGYDIRLSRNFAFGVEASSRDLEQPFVSVVGPEPESIFEDRKETIGRIYADWMPSASIAVSAAFVDDRFKAQDGVDTTTYDSGIPVRVDTRSLPLAVKYFSPRGWYAGATLTYVEQEVDRDVNPFAPPTVPRAEGKEEFNVVDLVFGYRLPRRMGSVSLTIQNAADEQFMYQDDSFREFRDEPSTGPYFPQRTALLSANFVF